MKGLLSRMMPVSAPPIPDEEEEEEDVEYSFAAEYEGPPVTYELPRAFPVDIKRIPIASVVDRTSLNGKFSLVPVVQPLHVVDPVKKEVSKELGLGLDPLVVAPKFEKNGGDVNERRVSSEISSSSTLGFSNSCDPSCELSDVIDSSGALGSSNGRECSRELSSRISSSDILEITNSDDNGSGEIGRLDVLASSKDSKESLDYVNDRSRRDWGSNESVLSCQLPSEIGSFRAEECGNVSLRNVKRTAVVTFLDVQTSGSIDEGFSPVESDTVLERKESASKGKKGSCYRCFKGNRFTEKEVCIVCSAKYCSNCVLRAMGSMPEGRKCVTCIGCPIDESKRAILGKCSRILKRLLSELEVRQIMKAEKLCEINQLQPEQVYVNGVQLCQEELDILQSCSNPPAKLKPGRYWYDKVSGLWGKEGQKPCKIISPHLNVGGLIMPDASNGNTKVFINNREITKVEFRMLQLAGVQCAGNPHFWLDEDGSYQEEGQKSVKGNLWSKAGTKLACTVLSLPIPSKAANPAGEEVNDLIGKVLPDYIEKRTLQKLLLVGFKGSGTSTIFKQTKILYKTDPFSEEERQGIKLVIQTSVYCYLGILLEGRERFEDESLTEMGKERLLDQASAIETSGERDEKTIYSISPKLKAFSDWLLKVMVSGNLEAIFPAATREYAPLVEELWKDDAIQATFKRRSELQMLPGVASYFLERVVDISRVDYEPSNTDILYAEGITSSNGLSCVDFSFPQSTLEDDPTEREPLLRYQLVRVHARGLGENCKWLEMFEDVRIVIFCVSLSDYDEFSDDGSGVTTNKMVASRTFFENIITHPVLEHMDFLLILNKFDLFEKKIEQIPLTRCEWFNDFNPVSSRQVKNSMNHTTLAQLGFHYIAVKFKRLFSSLTGRKLYVSPVNGLEPDTVDDALRYSREILKWDEERAYFSASEYSIYSTEASTSP